MRITIKRSGGQMATKVRKIRLLQTLSPSGVQTGLRAIGSVRAIAWNLGLQATSGSSRRGARSTPAAGRRLRQLASSRD